MTNCNSSAFPAWFEKDHFPGQKFPRLFHSYLLGKIPWLVHITSLQNGNVTGEQLQQNDRQQWCHGGMWVRNFENIIDHLFEHISPLGDNRDDIPVSRLDLLTDWSLFCLTSEGFRSKINSSLYVRKWFICLLNFPVNNKRSHPDPCIRIRKAGRCQVHVNRFIKIFPGVKVPFINYQQFLLVHDNVFYWSTLHLWTCVTKLIPPPPGCNFFIGYLLQPTVNKH